MDDGLRNLKKEFREWLDLCYPRQLQWVLDLWADDAIEVVVLWRDLSGCGDKFPHDHFKFVKTLNRQDYNNYLQAGWRAFRRFARDTKGLDLPEPIVPRMPKDEEAAPRKRGKKKGEE